MSSDSGINSSKLIKKADSFLWGLIVLIPFGWLALWTNINGRRKEVENGLRDKESAITSIKNYGIGAFLGLMILFCYYAAMSSSSINSGQVILIPNFIAIAVLAISSAHNISRINKVGSKSDYENDDSYISLDLGEYLANIKLLKRRLEALDKDDYDFDEEMAEIKAEIDRLFKEYEDAEFPAGGKYRLYELRAEYYFVKNNKNLAKKYIEKAAELKRSEVA